MLQVNVARLHEDNREALSLDWAGARQGGAAEVRREAAASAALIGHLNLTHPNSIQVIGAYEAGIVSGFIERLFEQAGLLFENHDKIARSTVFDSLFAREKLGTTGLGQGVAIPHGRIKGLKEALGAFLRLSQPVPFDAPDGNPVTLVFVLLVPEKATEKHLQILSELAQMFCDKPLREAMMQAADAAALHELITAWQPDAPGQRRAAA